MWAKCISARPFENFFLKGSVMSSKAIRICAVASLFAFVASPMAMGAGYEKTINWSGKWNGVAGAATGAVTGAEALFFNPAGIGGEAKNDVSANISPIFSKFTSPIGANATFEGKQTVSTPIGVMAAYKLNDSVAIAGGFYTAGGSRIAYENVVGTTPLDTSFAVNEAALGASYKLNDHWSIGATARYTIASNTTNALAGANAFTIDTKGNGFGGFRAGIQYNAKTWGYGISYRSKGTMKLEGTTASTVGALAGTYTLETSMPQALNVGGFIELNPTWKMFMEYGFANYAAVRTDTTAVASLGGTTSSSNFWNNQHIGRIGWECGSMPSTKVRLGYAITSKVTQDGAASAIRSNPGVGHGITLGAGQKFSDAFSANLALEYSFGKGTVATGTTPVGQSSVTAGDYKSTAYAAHVGLSYMF